MAGGKKSGSDKGKTRAHRPLHSVKRADTYGAKTIKTLSRISQKKQDEEIARSLELGLEAAPSIKDRSISLFSRGHQPAFAGINTFMKAPYCEDIRKVGEYEAAFVGVPFDTGTTYRPGTRFGPQAVRRISAVYDSYSVDGGVDLQEELTLCDAGDVFVIPGNIEKSFDQVSMAVSHVYRSGAFPISGRRRSQSRLSERARYCAEHRRQCRHHPFRPPYRHAGHGYGRTHAHDTLVLDVERAREREFPRHAPFACTHARCRFAQLSAEEPGADRHWRLVRLAARLRGRARRGSSVMTMKDVEKLGIQKTAEMALELAWKGAKAVYLSFDIDSIDPGFAPGTGTPEPGGFLPREALELVRLIAREGLCGMEVVEVSPPYDVNDNTAQLACRVILDVLGTLVYEGKLGHRNKVMK